MIPNITNKIKNFAIIGWIVGSSWAKKLPALLVDARVQYDNTILYL